MCTTGRETQAQKQLEFSQPWGPRCHLLMVPLGGVRTGWLVLLDSAPGLLPWNGPSLTPAREEDACCPVHAAHRPSGSELALNRAPRAPSCPQHWTGRWMRKLCPVKDLPRSGRCHEAPPCTSPGRGSSPGLQPQDTFSGPGCSGPEMWGPCHALSCDL